MVRVSASPPTVALLRVPRSCVGLIKSPHSPPPPLLENINTKPGGGGQHPHPPPHSLPPPLSCRQTEGQGVLVGGGHLRGHGAAAVAGVGHAGHGFTAVRLRPAREPGEAVGRTAAQVLHAGGQQVSQNTPELVTKLRFYLVVL